MARFRKGIRPVINSYKNVIDTEGSLAAGATSTTVIATAVELGVLDMDLNEVPHGGRLSSIYYSLYLFSDATEIQDSRVDILWWKQKGADIANDPIPGITGVSAHKNWVFHEEKGLAGNRTTGTPMVVKGSFKIPKSFQRMAFNDTIEMRIQSVENGLFCAKHIYKVFY